MTYHILNGDSLHERFLTAELSGQIIIARECLMDGDLSGNTLTEFWQTRAKYIETTYNEGKSQYYNRVVSEFYKIIDSPDDSEMNLWFGYDLFCQVNTWFILSLLHEKLITAKVYVVYPVFLKGSDIWEEFGQATAVDLITCFNNKIEFSEKDISFGKDLWIAYKNNDLMQLRELSETPSSCFPYLKNVCEAHIDRFTSQDGKGRPETVIENIVKNISIDFSVVFNEFFKREGVYGFSDLQVKQIYDKVIR